MKAIIDALNVVYDQKEERGFFKLYAISLFFTLGGLIAILTAIGLVVAALIAMSFHRAPQWRWVSAGSVAVTVAWMLGLAALSYYLANYAGYDATYESLGAAIGLMMWMSTIVVLFGAELNSELEHQTAKDSTEGGGKPLGLRGAEVADRSAALASFACNTRL